MAKGKLVYFTAEEIEWLEGLVDRAIEPDDPDREMADEIIQKLKAKPY